ncbi:MAG TPA: outer membrane beta-barrel protein, partial [Gemmatimonadales bacterium]|nr:outer membrane beta-barrel protein [Gemmatimonadales bacterium]
RLNGIDAGSTIWHFPLSLGVALTIPNPVFSIKPWVAPRIDFSRTRTDDAFTGSHSSTDTHFGLSGGIDLGFLSGLSVRAMYDRLNADNGVHPSVLSLGLGFRVGK